LKRVPNEPSLADLPRSLRVRDSNDDVSVVVVVVDVVVVVVVVVDCS
jgi:hypothetical protein